MTSIPSGIDVTFVDIVGVYSDDGALLDAYPSIGAAMQRAPNEGDAIHVGEVPCWYGVDGHWVPFLGYQMVPS